MIIGKTYDEINVGDRAYFEKTISEYDVYAFAGITGDFNPAHINEKESKQSIFKGRICHGLLSGSFISTVLGMYLPGPGCIYLSQTFNFKAPVRIGDTLRAEVEVIEKMGNNKIRLKTQMYNQDDKVVVDGEALVLAPLKKEA